MKRKFEGQTWLITQANHCFLRKQVCNEVMMIANFIWWAIYLNCLGTLSATVSNILSKKAGYFLYRKEEYMCWPIHLNDNIIDYNETNRVAHTIISRWLKKGKLYCNIDRLTIQTLNIQPWLCRQTQNSPIHAIRNVNFANRPFTITALVRQMIRFFLRI